MSFWRRSSILGFAALALLLAPAAAGAQSLSTLPTCELAPVFQPLQEAASAEVGMCRTPEEVHGGETLQVTSKGLLVWRKEGGWTGFIGASRTVILRPEGLVRRANTDRFDWELDGASAEAGMFADPASGLLPAGIVGPGFSVTDSTATDTMASSTISRPAQDRFRAARDVVVTVQVLPSPEVAHSCFLDLGNLQHGDMLLKTTQLGDETQVAAWRPDDVSSYSATFRQLALRARKSNAVVSVVLAPGTRLDTAVQLASMVFGRLR